MQLDAEEIAAWLRLMQADGVGAVTARTLLTHFGLPQNIFQAGHSALMKVASEAVVRSVLAPPSPDFESLLKRTLDWASQDDRHIVTLADEHYPRLLLDSADPPPMLYAMGQLKLLAHPAIAMVGSRNASRQGLQDAQDFAATLATAGYCVVSGMAQGIDSAAHEGALQAGGASTIAVIGTGADIVYPARNRALAHRIAEGGLILTEYPLGTPAIAANFPRRNRIISGLSCGVMVVEAALQSGSLITARLALDQGREVFAVPGSIHSPLSKGCHSLIRQGAKLVESAEDVLEELRPGQAGSMRRLTIPAAPRTVVDPALQALLELTGYDPVDFNTLVDRSGLDAASLSTQLLSLELAQLIEALPGARYRRLS